jgi:hypothetical protein
VAEEVRTCPWLCLFTMGSFLLLPLLIREKKITFNRNGKLKCVTGTLGQNQN